MRWRARFSKMERDSVAVSSDLTKLTDAEMLESFRANLKVIGIDWDEFKNDPLGAATKRFEGVPDDDGLIAGFLEAVGRLGGCSFEPRDQ